MDFIKENKAAIIVAALIAGMVVIGITANNSNETDKGDDAKQTSESKDKSEEEAKAEAEAEADKKTETTTTSNGTELEKTDTGLKMTARAGDNYTVLARQAVQNVDSKLSKAQIIAAETYLAQSAGEPAVDIDQAVEFKQADLDKAVKMANSLSEADLAAWQTYVQYVDFS